MHDDTTTSLSEAIHHTGVKLERWLGLDSKQQNNSIAIDKIQLETWTVTIQIRVTWGKAPPFGDDLSLTYLFASTSEKSYMHVTNDMLSIY